MIGAVYRVPLLGVTANRVRLAKQFFARVAQGKRVKVRLQNAHLPEVRQKQQTFERVQGLVSPGRPIGVPEGRWVTDCAAIGQCILLCSFCDPKFRPSHIAYGYVRDTKWPQGVGGMCDGCRVVQDQGIQLYVHESHIGHSYTPR